MAATVASARYIAHDTSLTPVPTNSQKVPADQARKSKTTTMNQNMDPTALPFQPGNSRPSRENHQPQNAFGAPPQAENYPQGAYDNYAAQMQYLAACQRWAQYYGYQGYQPEYYQTPQAYNPYNQPLNTTPHALPYGQHFQQNYPTHGFHNPASPPTSAMPYGGTNEELQYAFDTLIKNMKPKKRKSDIPHRAIPPPAMRVNPEANFEATFNEEEYGSLPRLIASGPTSGRVNKYTRESQAPDAQPGASKKKGRYGDYKIMLPAPLPTPEYLQQAVEKPYTTCDQPNHILVILDLNGTLLYRPNRNPKSMIERPLLRPFLRFLFENFSVMVWSSAKPENVLALVTKALDKNLQSKLVARWGRDSFGLSAFNYNQNVQVYKNLKLVWSRDAIQQRHPQYAMGQRFSQQNTVLIDDTVIKASAQPHNLLEIPEFMATPEQMKDNVLQEVAGYLEALRGQGDVSRFIHKQPFKRGRWSFQFPDEAEPSDCAKVATSTKKIKASRIV